MKPAAISMTETKSTEHITEIGTPLLKPIR